MHPQVYNKLRILRSASAFDTTDTEILFTCFGLLNSFSSFRSHVRILCSFTSRVLLSRCVKIKGSNYKSLSSPKDIWKGNSGITGNSHFDWPPRILVYKSDIPSVLSIRIRPGHAFLTRWGVCLRSVHREAYVSNQQSSVFSRPMLIQHISPHLPCLGNSLKGFTFETHTNFV